MSQHDGTIANAGGATVRTDIQSAIQAALSSSSGTARPATPYQAQNWVDTNTPSASVWSDNVYDGADDILRGYFDTTNNQYIAANEVKAADVASATTTDIGAARGTYLDVTGTTTITGLGTVQAGTRRIVRFTGALTLTHNATSLILPGAANIVTVADDVATFVSLGSGNWRCVSYRRSAASPLGWQTLESAAPASAASYIRDSIPSWVNFLRITGDLFPASDGVALNLLARKSSGTDITSYDYQAVYGTATTAAAATAGGQSAMALFSTVQSDANVGGAAFQVVISNIQSSRYKRALVTIFSRDGTPASYIQVFGFLINDTAALTGIKLLFGSGNINDGRVLVEGAP